MSSSVVIELDTTAPQVTLGESQVTADRDLVIPYTITEPDIIMAELIISGYDPISMTFTGGELRASLPVGVASTLSNVNITTRDDVLNERFTSFMVPLWGGKAVIKAILSLFPILRAFIQRATDLVINRNNNYELKAQVEPDIKAGIEVGPDIAVQVEIEVEE